MSNDRYSNRDIELPVAAAHICEDCGHATKVERVPVIATEADTCQNCGSTNLVVADWDDVEERP